MRRAKTDKAGVFGYYWHIFAPDMPRPEPEYPFTACIGRKHRADFAFPFCKILIEIDGGNRVVKYSRKTGRHVAVGSHTQDSDYEKLNLAASLRWLVFRFSPQMLERDPAGCVALVKQAIKDSE